MSRGVKSVSIGIPQEIIDQVEKYHQDKNKQRGIAEKISKSQTYSILIAKGLNEK